MVEYGLLPVGVFLLLLIGGGLLIVAGIVVVIVLIVRNIGHARRLGLDPMTTQVDLAARVLNSGALAPQRTIAQRLAELDDLLAAGTITADEHRAARAKILGAP